MPPTKSAGQTLKQLIRRSRFGGGLSTCYRRVTKSYLDLRTDCYVVSHPKCGRTWLRIMLAKAFALHFRIPQSNLADPSELLKAAPNKVPRIRFTHNGVSRPPTAQQAQGEKRYRKFCRKRVIFLVRDPRDVLASYYFQRTRRRSEQHDLSQFLRDPVRGIDRIIAFMNGWYAHRHLPSAFLLVRYEDLHRDTPGGLRTILAFLGFSDVSDDVIQESVHYASFVNMRRLSMNELRHVPTLAPANAADPESYKVRKGRVGGYTEYLQPADIAYLETRMRATLHPYFEYPERVHEAARAEPSLPLRTV